MGEITQGISPREVAVDMGSEAAVAAAMEMAGALAGQAVMVTEMAVALAGQGAGARLGEESLRKTPRVGMEVASGEGVGSALGVAEEVAVVRMTEGSGKRQPWLLRRWRTCRTLSACRWWKRRLWRTRRWTGPSSSSRRLPLWLVRRLGAGVEGKTYPCCSPSRKKGEPLLGQSPPSPQGSDREGMRGLRRRRAMPPQPRSSGGYVRGVPPPCCAVQNHAVYGAGLRDVRGQCQSDG